MPPPSSLVTSQGWGLIDLPLRASNEGWFIWFIWSIWLVGPEIHPEEPDRPERPANQTDEPGRVARAQKSIRLHPLLFFSIPLPDGRFQADSGLHGVGNQTVRLGFLDQLLGFVRISARRERDGGLQRNGRELKLPIDQFQPPFGHTLVRGKGQTCSLRHRQERRHQTDVGGRDEYILRRPDAFVSLELRRRRNLDIRFTGTGDDSLALLCPFDCGVIPVRLRPCLHDWGLRKGVGSLFSPHGPPLFSLDGMLDGLPLRMFIELTDAPSKLARDLFRDGG